MNAKWKLPEESYVLIEARGHEIFIYDDGQLEIRDGKGFHCNLEVLDFDSMAELQARFFDILTGRFGEYSR